MKFYYNGIPLHKYCEKNLLDYLVVADKVYRLKNYNPELSNEDVVRLVIEDNVKGILKYAYNGLPLSEYCKQNSLNYSAIISLIVKVKKANPKLSNNEIVRLIIEDDVIKCFYEGLSFKKYCEQNSLNYGNVISRVYRLKKAQPNLSEVEAIKLAIENNFDTTKYFYKGVTLSEYCEQNSLNYGTIRSRILKLKKKHQELAIDELIKIALENCNNSSIKYMYEGVTLSEYCEQHSLNYGTVTSRIYRLKKAQPNLSEVEAIKLAIENNYDATKYFYEGVTLSEYCKQNSLNYETIKSRILKLKKKHQELAIDELIKIALANCNNSSIKYMYNELSLYQYCKNNNINYNTILYRLHKLKTDCPELETNKLIELSLKLEK